MNKKDVIIERIKKLKAHAESAKGMGSLEEAESFMLKVTELINEYNISMSEIDAHQVQEKDKFKNWQYTEHISYNDKHQGWQWKKELMSVICQYHFTSYTFNSILKTLRVYGNMENVDITVWLYHFLEIGLFNLAEKKYQEELKIKNNRDKEEARRFSRVEAYKFKRDFLLGAVSGFQDQLSEQRRNATIQTKDIILYNDKALNEYVQQKLTNVRYVQSKPLPSVGYGYNHGYKAGKNFKVNKPLSDNSKKQNLL